MRWATLEGWDGDRDLDLRLPIKRLLRPEVGWSSAACWDAAPEDCWLESDRPLAGLPGGLWAALGSDAGSGALDGYRDSFLFEGHM